MISFFKRNSELLLIFLLSLTPIWWLRNGEIIIGHDSGFRLNYFEHLKNLFYSWNANHNFGSDWAILKGFLIIQAPESFFSFIFNSVWLGEIATFIFWFFIMGLAMYVTIRNFFPEKEYAPARLIGSIFYMYNFFILQGWFIAERAKFSLFAALPLGFLIIYKALNREYSLLKSTIFFSLLSFFLNGGGSPPLYGSLVLTYAVTFIFLTLTNIKRNGFKEIIFSVKVFVSIFLGFFLINSYFIFPQIYAALNSYSGMLSSIGGISGILAWEAAINKYASILNLLRLQGIPDWYDNPSHIYAKEFIDNPALIVLSFIPILLVTIGLSLIKMSALKDKTKIIYLLLIIMICGLVFASGSHPPFGFLYVFLVKHLPGFAIFRSAIYKFGPALWMSLIFLSAIYLNLIINKYVKNKKVYKIVVLSSVIFILLYHFPFFASNFFKFSNPFTTKVAIPGYIYDANNYLNSDNKDLNILLLPRLDPYYKVDSYKWGFWSLEPISKLSLNHSVISNDTVSPEIINEIYETDNRDYLNKLLGRFGINKLILRNDVLYNDKKTDIHTLSKEVNGIIGSSNVSLDKKFGEWEIYNVSSSDNNPYVSVQEKVIDANINKKHLEYLLGNEDKSSVIVFNEPDNYLSRDIIGKISNKSYFEPECYLCQDREFNNLKNQIVINDSNILPGSTFYKIKKYRENKLKAKFSTGPGEIDFNLSMANKRISEYKGILRSENLSASQKDKYLKSVGEEYKSEIENAVLKVKNLNEIEKNKYNIKIYTYLDTQISYLKEINFDLNSSVNKELNSFVNQKEKELQSDFWYSTGMSKKLIINIDKEGDYFIGSYSKNRKENFLLDGKNIVINNNYHLNTGSHIIEIIAKEYKLDEKNTDLKLNGNIEIDHPKNTIEKDHYLTFEYFTLKDTFLDITLRNNEKSNKITIDLKHHPESRVYSLKLSKDLLVNYSKIFLTNNDSTNERISIKNVLLSEDYDANLYLSRNMSGDRYSTPQVTYEKINPTKTIVKIKKASAPFILTINNSYNPGWKIYEGNKNILSLFFSKAVFEKDHIKSYGYSNSWYIDKKGDYEFTVYYEPQKAFYVGGVITIATLISIIYLIYKRKK